MKHEIHIFRSYNIEVGTARPGTKRQQRPGYRWATGWSEALPDGAMSQPYRLYSWQDLAAEAGARLRRHASEKSARAGLEEFRKRKDRSEQGKQEDQTLHMV